MVAVWIPFGALIYIGILLICDRINLETAWSWMQEELLLTIKRKLLEGQVLDKLNFEERKKGFQFILVNCIFRLLTFDDNVICRTREWDLSEDDAKIREEVLKWKHHGQKEGKDLLGHLVSE